MQCLEHNWRPKIVDFARENQKLHDEVYMQDFEYMEEEEQLLCHVEEEDE